MGDEDLTWEQVREGAAEGMAPIESDSQTGAPVPTVTLTPGQPRIWPWVLGVGVLLYVLSRR